MLERWLQLLLMRIFSKSIYALSIAYICLCCLIALLLATLPIEFKDHRLQDKSTSLFFIGIPTAILFTLFKLGFKDRNKINPGKEVIKTVLLASGVSLLLFSYVMLTFGSSMCRSVTGQTIFINKHSASVKIVKRHLGCGATDSSPESTTISMQRDVLSTFFYYSIIDTFALIKSDWIRVSE